MSRLKDQTIAETEGYVKEEEEAVVEQESNAVKSEAVLSKLGELVNKALDEVKKDVQKNAEDIEELRKADERLRDNINGLANCYAEVKAGGDGKLELGNEQLQDIRKSVSDAIAGAKASANEEVKMVQMKQAELENKIDDLVSRMKAYEEGQAQLVQLVSEIQGKIVELETPVPVPEPTPVVEPAPTKEPLKEPGKPSLYERLHPKKIEKEPKEALPFYVAIRTDGEEVTTDDEKDSGRIVDAFERIAITKANNIEPGEHKAKEVYYWVDENGERLFRVSKTDVTKF